MANANTHHLVIESLRALRFGCACGAYLAAGRLPAAEEQDESLYQVTRLRFLEHARHVVTHGPGHTIVIPAKDFDQYRAERLKAQAVEVKP